jgi:hypothetical protein
MPRRHDAGPLLPRAVDLAGDADVVGAVATLGRERTFDLQAAYAAATRRRTDGPGYARAAELLETALLARRRRLLRPPGRFSRPEVLFPLWIGSYVVWFVLQAVAVGGPYVGAGIGSATASVGLVFLLLWQRRTDGAPFSLADGGRADLERFSDAVAAVVRLAETGEATPSDLVAAADDQARGVGGRLVTAAAVVEAERRAVAGVLPAHRRLRPVLAEARELAVSRPEVAELRGERR